MSNPCKSLELGRSLLASQPLYIGQMLRRWSLLRNMGLQPDLENTGSSPMPPRHSDCSTSRLGRELRPEGGNEPLIRKCRLDGRALRAKSMRICQERGMMRLCYKPASELIPCPPHAKLRELISGWAPQLWAANNLGGGGGEGAKNNSPIYRRFAGSACVLGHKLRRRAALKMVHFYLLPKGGMFLANLTKNSSF